MLSLLDHRGRPVDSCLSATFTMQRHISRSDPLVCLLIVAGLEGTQNTDSLPPANPPATGNPWNQTRTAQATAFRFSETRHKSSLAG